MDDIFRIDTDIIIPQEYLDESRINAEEKLNSHEVVKELYGSIRYLDEIVMPFSYRNNPAIQIVVNDITERRKIEWESDNVRKQLRALTFELMLAEDRERGRIAIDLHDEIGQSMIAARLMLGTVKDATDMPDNAVKKIEEIRTILQDSINWARTLSVDLSPPVVRELGIEAGIQWLGTIFEKRHGLNVVVNIPNEKIDISVPIRIIAFVTTRELLYNVVKQIGRAHV